MKFNFLKYFKKRTIRTNLIIALLAVSLIPAIIINIFYYVRMNSFIENKVQAYYSEIVKQTSEQINNIYKQIEIAERQLINSAITSGVLDSYDEMSAEERLIAVKQLEQSLQNIRRSFSIISNMYLISDNNNLYTAGTITGKGILLNKEWIKSIRAGKYEGIIIPTHISNYRNRLLGDENEKVISFARSIIGIENNQRKGIVQLDLSYSEIKEIVESLSLNDQSFMIITDQNNNVIYSSNEMYLGQKLVESKKEEIIQKLSADRARYVKSSPMVTNYIVPELNWLITGVISTEDIDNEFEKLGNITWVITILIILLSVILTYLLSREVLRPISRLVKNMKKVGEGRLDIKVSGSKNRDLQVLTDSFNTMVNKIDILMKNVREKEKEKLKAELKALQSQINSHFLYNTLNSIKWMALIAKQDSIANAIISLVKILEYSSKNLEKIVPISEEIDFTKNYVHIQQMRSGDHIKVEFDIDEELFEYMILKLTLQPIIENAFLHAFNDKDEGKIIIKGSISDEYITFEIIDNGSGMEVKQLDKMTCMGMENVNTRIQLNFGEKYGLKIYSEPGEGTHVKILLPIIKRGESLDV